MASSKLNAHANTFDLSYNQEGLYKSRLFRD